MLEGAQTVGITAAASTPPAVVARVVDALNASSVEERVLRTEQVNFPLPTEVR
jgi:4-hydroxy-3-methylbut-2-enyl diphosphate reductase IspH